MALAQGVRAFVVEICATPESHAELLSNGPRPFKPLFVEGLKAVLQDHPEPITSLCDPEQLALSCFRRLEAMWVKLHPEVSPRGYLDLYIPPTNITESDLKNMVLEVEIASRDDYMAKVWEGSARVRRGKIDELGMREDATVRGLGQ